MGLDVACECDAFRFKMGSYTTVQRIRVQWIKAEALRQETRGRNDIADEMRQVVQGDRVNYQAFRSIRNLWHPGTVAFVNHSDAGGFWTSSQVVSIYNAILSLKSFFKETFEACWFYEEDGSFFLEDLFEHCSDRLESVELL